MASLTQAEPATSPPSEFIRGIGPLAAISLVVGSMIGSGIFIVSADIGRQVSDWGPGALLLVWLITGAMTVTGALAYSELAAMMPKAGGQYVFLREGLSPATGFLYGWTLFAVIQTGTIAAVAVAFGRFLSVLVPSVSPDVFLPLGQLRLPGAADARNNVTFAAAEVRDPTRNLPRALAIGTGLVSLLYILSNVAYLNILPFYGDPNGTDVLARGLQYAAQDRVGTAAIEVALGAGAATIMAIAILLSTFGCNNGLILSGPRVYYAMARDRLFFERAGRLHPEFRTPVFGLVAQAFWAMVLCVSGTYGQLLDYVIFAALVFYFLTTLALFRLRRTRPDLPRPVKAFGYPMLPALYMVAVAGIMVVLLVYRPLYTWPGLLIVATGIPVYLIWRKALHGTGSAGRQPSA